MRLNQLRTDWKVITAIVVRAQVQRPTIVVFVFVVIIVIFIILVFTS